MSRLRKIVESNMINLIVPSAPSGFLIRDIDKKIVDKDKIEDITYGPSISREWDFEKPVDNPEWALQTDFTKNINR